MDYNFTHIEKKWQQHWDATNAYKVENDTTKPKCYVLDMFPYPSGAGLHVGHPLGYIASDIYSRYKRLKGYNVLHPMGYDAFGLPAEQYAIEHGIHPAESTANNMVNFRAQLNNIGFSYDWSRQVNTSEPQYYKWTQWLFLQLYNSYYNITINKAYSVINLITQFENQGSATTAVHSTKHFTANDWAAYTHTEQLAILMQHRLAYCGYGEVNWCQALGTVLANDEVVNGVSERGGHPVEKKRLRQWYLRITDYADRLLQGLEQVQFSDAMKDMQRNWIGKSTGAEIKLKVMQTSKSLEKELEINATINNSNEVVTKVLPNGEDLGGASIDVYTTRPDTIFGVDFVVLAPEHNAVQQITTAEQQQAVTDYITYVKSRSERDRMVEKKITGCFTGAYALNPFNQTPIPIYISEYVLAGYGTGAIMAVPCGDERDFKFAQHFNIPITNIIGNHYNGTAANPTKDAVLENSDFLNGLVMKDAMAVAIDKMEELGFGKRKVNYKMRDAAFSRQRYWGEPFPMVWQGETAYDLPESILPLELPHLTEIKPGDNAQGPLANLPEWVNDWQKYFAESNKKNSSTESPSASVASHTNPPLRSGGALETSTMPGFAGSSWYFLRYMDPHNTTTFCDKSSSDYWNQVDVYVGGTEHAVGHLLYSRMFTKFMYDKGLISFDEPFKKLINQGMITGSSRFVYRVNGTNTFVSKEFVDENEMYNGEKLDKLHVDVNIVDGDKLDIEAFKKWRNGEYANAEFILEDGKYICGSETEKMSKSKFNTVNPDQLVAKYGADTFRMYEMFLGPVEMSKPWDTKGIEGVHRFLKKLWRLFYAEGTIININEKNSENSFNSIVLEANNSNTTIPNPSPLERGRGEALWNNQPPTPAELKVLHKTIKKIDDDTEKFSYNTAVSAFMIAVNELTELKCQSAAILEQLLILLHPYAPHITQELYHSMNPNSRAMPYGEGINGEAIYPKYNAQYTTESTKEYPISVNGKMRTTMNFAIDAEQQTIEDEVSKNEIVLKWLEGKTPKRIVFVKNKMVNVVV